MSAEVDPIGYDEDDAVKFIQNFLPQEFKGKFSNDEINYIIDIIYEFYEDKGLLNESSSDDEIIDIDEDELTEFVLKNTKKDKLKEFSADEITFIIQGELAYCESINLFE
ncbi:hypothetical protein G7050_13465 [Dysgonomonas sp. HDW5A]|uniref:hypothetical protein n=1 Tax=unclassified Dysgonomonas TaxID=2630389 RepID=UPI001408199A|nr:MULTISPECIES: hypothetical protein [unclassified Dysgonomonas]QIK55367.1 hypothetical protein G7051_13815 [Dysgonomonas sp. HDW5B]QIK60791.1 hypothetical protein G7050_13465 [Dysgonomonas sp. HDW5A]